MATISFHPQALDLGLFLLRLTLGIIFFAHGAQKVLGWYGGKGLMGTASSMKMAMGIPAPLSILASYTEFFGAIAVMLGVLTRVAAAGLGITMLVALFKVHGKNGFWARSQGYEYNLALFSMSLLLVLAGPGQIAILR